jgi:FAD synthase
MFSIMFDVIQAKVGRPPVASDLHSTEHFWLVFTDNISRMRANNRPFSVLQMTAVFRPLPSLLVAQMVAKTHLTHPFNHHHLLGSSNLTNANRLFRKHSADAFAATSFLSHLIIICSVHSFDFSPGHHKRTTFALLSTSA